MRLWSLRAVVALACAVFVVQGARAQTSTVAEGADTRVDLSLTNITRVETWRFFDPPPSGGDPDYTFPGNRTHVTVRVRAPRFDLRGGFAYVAMRPLPDDAVGPGPLGTGALYAAAAEKPYSYQLFLSELALSAHSTDRRVTLTMGRMSHSSGAEGEGESPDTKSPGLGTLRRLRLEGRLIGPFDWSFYGRRFDGARLTLDRSAWYGGVAAFAPTQGTFEESANLTMPSLQVASGFAGLRAGRSPDARTRAETQAFLHFYRDRRNVAARPDNTGRRADAADVSVLATGASQLGSRLAGPGRLDWLAWLALEGGDWYGQSHRAWALALEGGYQWPAAAGQPWLRAGINHASGDDNPADDRHETFFTMLPTTRNHALSTVYAQMNLRDTFVQVLAEPHRAMRLRLDLHRLDLAEASDRWYEGSGATASDGPAFGYTVRPSSGARRLGTMLEGAVDVAVTRAWSINGYVGHMWGGPVVRGLFSDDRLTFWYVENVLRWVGTTQ